MQPVNVTINIYVGSDSQVTVKEPPSSEPKTVQAVIDDEPIPQIDPSDAFSTPGLDNDPYGIKNEPPKTETSQPAEPTDTLTEIARSLCWLDTAADPLNAAKCVLEYHPAAAAEMAKAQSVEELDKIITGLGTTKASEVGGRIREQGAWAGKFLCGLCVGLGRAMPTGLKPEPETK